MAEVGDAVVQQPNRETMNPVITRKKPVRRGFVVHSKGRRSNVNLCMARPLLSRSRDDSKNQSKLKKMTLRSNNRALAKALSLQKQECQQWYQEVIRLKAERQDLKEALAHMEQLQAKDNFALQNEVEKRLKLCMEPLKLVLNEALDHIVHLSESLTQALNLTSAHGEASRSTDFKRSISSIGNIGSSLQGSGLLPVTSSHSQTTLKQLKVSPMVGGHTLQKATVPLKRIDMGDMEEIRRATKRQRIPVPSCPTTALTPFDMTVIGEQSPVEERENAQGEDMTEDGSTSEKENEEEIQHTSFRRMVQSKTSRRSGFMVRGSTRKSSLMTEPNLHGEMLKVQTTKSPQQGETKRVSVLGSGMETRRSSVLEDKTFEQNMMVSDAACGNIKGSLGPALSPVVSLEDVSFLMQNAESISVQKFQEQECKQYSLNCGSGPGKDMKSEETPMVRLYLMNTKTPNSSPKTVPGRSSQKNTYTVTESAQTESPSVDFIEKQVNIVSCKSPEEAASHVEKKLPLVGVDNLEVKHSSVSDRCSTGCVMGSFLDQAYQEDPLEGPSWRYDSKGKSGRNKKKLSTNKAGETFDRLNLHDPKSGMLKVTRNLHKENNEEKRLKTPEKTCSLSLHPVVCVEPIISNEHAKKSQLNVRSGFNKCGKTVENKNQDKPCLLVSPVELRNEMPRQSDVFSIASGDDGYHESGEVLSENITCTQPLEMEMTMVNGNICFPNANLENVVNSTSDSHLMDAVWELPITSVECEKDKHYDLQSTKYSSPVEKLKAVDSLIVDSSMPYVNKKRFNMRTKKNERQTIKKADDKTGNGKNRKSFLIKDGNADQKSDLEMSDAKDMSSLKESVVTPAVVTVISNETKQKQNAVKVMDVSVVLTDCMSDERKKERQVGKATVEKNKMLGESFSAEIEDEVQVPKKAKMSGTELNVGIVKKQRKSRLSRNEVNRCRGVSKEEPSFRKDHFSLNAHRQMLPVKRQTKINTLSKKQQDKSNLREIGSQSKTVKKRKNRRSGSKHLLVKFPPCNAKSPENNSASTSVIETDDNKVAVDLPVVVYNTAVEADHPENLYSEDTEKPGKFIQHGLEDTEHEKKVPKKAVTLADVKRKLQDLTKKKHMVHDDSEINIVLPVDVFEAEEQIGSMADEEVTVDRNGPSNELWRNEVGVNDAVRELHTESEENVVIASENNGAKELSDEPWRSEMYVHELNAVNEIPVELVDDDNAVEFSGVKELPDDELNVVNRREDSNMVDPLQCVVADTVADNIFSDLDSQSHTDSIVENSEVSQSAEKRISHSSTQNPEDNTCKGVSTCTELPMTEKLQVVGEPSLNSDGEAVVLDRDDCEDHVVKTKVETHQASNIEVMDKEKETESLSSEPAVGAPRQRRAAASIPSFKEPKLNSKLRQGDVYSSSVYRDFKPGKNMKKMRKSTK